MEEVRDTERDRDTRTERRYPDLYSLSFLLLLLYISLCYWAPQKFQSIAGINRVQK